MSSSSSSSSSSAPSSSSSSSSSPDRSFPSLNFQFESSSSSSTSSSASASCFPLPTSSSLTDSTIYRSVAADSYSSVPAPGFDYSFHNNHNNNSNNSSANSTLLFSGTEEALGQFDSFTSGISSKQLYSLHPKYESSSASHFPSVVVVAPPPPVCTPSVKPTEEEQTGAFSDPPSPPGGYLEPSTHFFTNTSPLSTLKDLVSHLEQLFVDCTYVMDSYKIKCVAYSREGGNRVEFVVRVWKAEDRVREGGCKFAVEFQRRFGEGMLFYQIYEQIKKQIQAGNSEIHLCCPSSLSSRALFECPPLVATSDSPLPPISLATYRESLSHLQSMLSCECVDVKAQALSALCEMSASASNDPQLKQLLLDEGCLSLFISHLFCGYSDVHRLALTALANLTTNQDPEVCGQVFRDERAKNGVQKCVGSECAQVVRESARTVSNVFQALGERCYEDEEWKKCAEKLAGCTDGQAQRQVAQMMEALQLS